MAANNRRKLAKVSLFIIGAVILILLPAAFIITNRTYFACGFCHEMKSRYQAWQASTHNGVKCGQCHNAMSFSRMTAVHFSGKEKGRKIAGDVTASNCRKCHSETRELIVYHSLKITHKQHWNMGISCIFCHSDVVHGASSKFKNTPSMDTCFKCHDGRKASNTCTVCHATLGERKPVAFNPEWVEAHKVDIKQNGKTCARCHGEEFCRYCHMNVNPHGGNWLRTHDTQSKKQTKKCDVCHNKSFCVNCHKIKKAHSLNWIDRHAGKAAADPAPCRECHEQNFCFDCHSKLVTHPGDWIILHPLKVKESPDSCLKCHSRNFCSGCHDDKLPPDHKKEWLSNHGRFAGEKPGAAGARCESCHAADFCWSCHKGRKPGSHKTNWIHGHREAAENNADACYLCHDRKYCLGCHKGEKPKSHGTEWVKAHGGRAKKDMNACRTCHGERFCFSCHQVEIPHNRNWSRRHGAVTAGKSKRVCLTCHEEDECKTCHENRMPQSHTAADWSKTHGAETKKDQSACKACHARDLCDNCHQMDMPHPGEWALEHSATAKEKGKRVCLKCHEADFCSTCHAAPPD